MPQQVYFDAVRDLFLSADGMHFYGRFHDDLGNLSLNAGVGCISVGKNVETSYLGADFPGGLDFDDPSFVVRAEFATNDGAWRLALSAAKATPDFDAGSTSFIGSGDISSSIGLHCCSTTPNA